MSEAEVKAEEGTEEVASEDPTSEEPSSQGDGDDVAAKSAGLASQLMKNPAVLAALQDRLGSMVGHSSGYIQSLPKSVKRRLKALKKMQFEATKIEAEFYREVHRLECEYAAKYLPLFDKRSTIVKGDYEPNDEEADWPSDDEREEDLANDTEQASGDKKDEVEKKASIEDKKDGDKEEKDESKGIPGFWLTIFKNVDMLSDMVQPNDEPILNHLTDIKVEFQEKDPMGFTLEFFFEANEHFENKKLTKEYIMRSEPEEGDPFSFEGPEIIKCNGCKIDWKKGKNVTVKTVKKKQKHKSSGTTRTIQKTVQNDSFFNFFSPPTPADDEEMDEDTEALLAADFEIGHFIRERIVPRAVLYFTGEALENEEDEYDEGEDEEGAEEGEYDEDGDPDYNPGRVKFVTREFQTRCARLALGCHTEPSSAPCDTRLFMRPSSGSALHRTMPEMIDPRNRPQTAPSSGAQSMEGNIKPGERPPEVNDEAFMVNMHDLSQTSNVKSTRPHARTNKLAIPDNTEVFLPNAMDSQGIEVREKSKGQKHPVAQPRTQFIKPPVLKMQREKSFMKTMKSPRDVIKGRPMEKPSKGMDAMESLDEYSESEDEAVQGNKLVQQQARPTTSIIRHARFEGSQKQVRVVTHQTSDAGKDGDYQVKNTRQVGMKKPGGKEQGAKVDSGAQGKPGIPDNSANSRTRAHEAGIQQTLDPRAGQLKGVYPKLKKRLRTNEEKQALEEKKNKEIAFNKMQKLTGKHLTGHHKPGDVPSIGRQPSRKLKNEDPPQSKQSVGQTAGTSSGSSSGSADNKTFRVRQEIKQRTSAQKISDHSNLERQGTKSEGSAPAPNQASVKPASAPVSHPARHSRSHGNRELGKSMGFETDEQKMLAQSAELRSRDRMSKTIGSRIDSRWDNSKSLMFQAESKTKEEEPKQTSNPDKTSQQKDKQPVRESIKDERKRTQHGAEKQATASAKVRQQGSASKPDKPKSSTVDPSDRQRSTKDPSVKLQNAMISTNTKVSDPKQLQEGEDPDVRASSAASSVHPKLQDSPYFKDNPLLTGKQRRSKQPGASSAHGPPHDKDQS